MTTIEVFYLLMLLLQVLHILEEIAFKAYEVVGNLNKYLLVASILVTVNFGTFFLIGNQIQIGLYLGLFASLVLAFGNGLIHVYGWVRTRSTQGTLGAGIYSSLPLGIVGVVVFLRIINNLPLAS